MARLPVFQRLDVEGYELYPGSPDAPGLSRALDPGITLIVGANGLGKTTLLTLVRHMCAGRSRLRARSGGSFGAGALEWTEVESDTFAVRVSDGAASAVAQLEMRIGTAAIAVRRNLVDLRLVSLTLDEEELEASEEVFREVISDAADVGEYADWLLLIDHLSFITEDRFLPFWDKDVQRHLLRVVANTGSLPSDLARAEDAHVSATSDYRNAVFQQNRYRERYARERAKQSAEAEVLAELEELSTLDARLKASLAEARASVRAAEAVAERSVRDAELGEQQLIRARDALEAGRLQYIDASIPGADDVSRYVLARVRDAGVCPVCLRGWPGGLIEEGSCVVCGQNGDQATPDGVDLSDLELAVARWSGRVAGARSASDAATDELRRRSADIHRLTAEISAASERSRRLQAKLPSDSQAASTLRAVLDGLEADVEVLNAARMVTQDTLASLTKQSNDSVIGSEASIKEVFDKLATLFLVEKCELVPHERAVRVAQVGPPLQVRSFDINLGSATSAGESRRTEMGDVSESQRVFIDIAFRIALIATCLEDAEGTLVMDAPEGSLDAIFTENAALLMASFLEYSAENRLVVATNLIEGSLLPSLARHAGIASIDDPALIDLIELAAPTAAVEAHRERYRSILQKAISGDGGDT